MNILQRNKIKTQAKKKNKNKNWKGFCISMKISQKIKLILSAEIRLFFISWTHRGQQRGWEQIKKNL